jgi:hypothetical protein
VTVQTETPCLHEFDELEAAWAKKHTLAQLAG